MQTMAELLADPLVSPAAVAVVDDESDITLAIETLLSFRGLRCSSHHSAESFLNATSVHDGRLWLQMADGVRAAVGVVLLDMNLPEMNGADLVMALRRLQPDIRLVMMTAALNEVVDTRMADLQGVTMLEKPFTLEALEKALQLV